jgi:general secretion pathway protein G
MKAFSEYPRAFARGILFKRRNRPCGGPGFTLLELLVVLAILAIIAAVAAPLYFNQLAKAKVRAAEIQVQQLGTILDMYRLDVGGYPSTSDGLESLMTSPPGVDRWAGPYLKNRDSLTDPWGNPYGYRAPGDHGDYDLWSNGADGSEGGEDDNADIISW